jgi:hypothetical protein
MSKSPIDELLGAVDKLDLDGALELMAPDCQLLTVDGRRAEGIQATRDLLGDFLAALRSTAHRITAQWHENDAWIAEVEVDYELQDRLQVKALPRAFVVRSGPHGISAVHVYGAHERATGDHGSHQHEGLRVGGRWIPPM